MVKEQCPLKSQFNGQSTQLLTFGRSFIRTELLEIQKTICRYGNGRSLVGLKAMLMPPSWTGTKMMRRELFSAISMVDPVEGRWFGTTIV